MNRKYFFEQIKKDFFVGLSADLEGFKEMVRGALPVFGHLETRMTEKDDGGKMIQFIDVDEADVVLLPQGVDADDIDTDMTTTLMTLHVDENGTIKAVEHSFHLFTPANKEEVLFLASLIGKKIEF